MEKKYLFNTSKINYVKGKKKPSVQCILCSIVDDSEEVENLTVYKDKLASVALNLYPFNPGHLMIFPNRHVLGLEELTSEEVFAIHKLTSNSILILNELLEPSGYNIGYNMGCWSGGSIDHIHQHIVPRYENEIGFLDVLSGTRIVVSDPRDLIDKLRISFYEKIPQGDR